MAQHGDYRLTLPIALIGTFGVITCAASPRDHADGVSLCVGLLIDDAIVVREHRAPQPDGQDHRSAALDGTNEIGLAVLATTFSIVAVFLRWASWAASSGASSTSSASPWWRRC
ncbi:protein of unknown function [Cupriavidus taiwanensis]|nr:protein of unknown function [Cupriavidus taiwanensis]